MSEFECWYEENAPPGGARRVDLAAVLAWLERNPDATREDLRQVLMAPDHNLGEIGEEAGEEEQ